MKSINHEAGYRLTFHRDGESIRIRLEFLWKGKWVVDPDAGISFHENHLNAVIAILKGLT